MEDWHTTRFLETHFDSINSVKNIVLNKVIVNLILGKSKPLGNLCPSSFFLKNSVGEEKTALPVLY
jgi:hypothetical protein